MQKLAKIRPENQFCLDSINIDPDIRFVGILCKCGRLKAYRRKNDMVPQLNVPETKVVQREALLKAKMNGIFDKKLGKTRWSIELRENVKWITIYHNKDLILLSTETSSNHDKIIREIISVLQLTSF